MKTASTIVLLGLLQLGVAAPALAENTGGTFTLTPITGGYMFDSDQELDMRPIYGVRGGYNFTDHWGAEFKFGIVRTETDLMTPADRDVDVYRYGIEGLYHFNPKGPWVPFLAVGYGGIHIDTPWPINDYDHGMFDYGAGIKYFVSDTVALRGDIRHALYKESGEMQNNIEYTVGVTFNFGGPKRVVAAVKCPACPPVAVVKKVAPVLVVLEDTHFQFDSARLTRDGATILDGNIEILKANPKTNVRVAGYTSAAGTAEYNQKLSERRATAVREYLIAGGIASNRLTQIGYGQTRPAQYEPVPENVYSKEAKSNMRVLFEIIVQ
jgi:OmpA-OmpF porin, OOP family